MVHDDHVKNQGNFNEISRNDILENSETQSTIMKIGECVQTHHRTAVRSLGTFWRALTGSRRRTWPANTGPVLCAHLGARDENKTAKRGRQSTVGESSTSRMQFEYPVRIGISWNVHRMPADYWTFTDFSKNVVLNLLAVVMNFAGWGNRGCPFSNIL